MRIFFRESQMPLDECASQEEGAWKGKSGRTIFLATEGREVTFCLIMRCESEIGA